MTIGYGTATANSQIFPVPVLSAFKPMAWGPTYTGPAMWPRQGVYNQPPVLPSASMQAVMPASAYGGTPGETGTYSAPSALSSSGSPWGLTTSPLWWALGFLVIGLAGLHFIHFK